jgi:hypothetical protein
VHHNGRGGIVTKKKKNGGGGMEEVVYVSMDLPRLPTSIFPKISSCYFDK